MDRRALLLAESARSRLAADSLRRQAEFESLAGFEALSVARAEAALAEWSRALMLERQALQNAA